LLIFYYDLGGERIYESIVMTAGMILLTFFEF